MKSYLAKLYEGVEAAHSFLDAGGQVFDCIPIEQQPSLKGTGRKLATPPEPPVLSTGATSLGPPPRARDRLGNSTICPPGTIPFRRITLENLARFATLREFFQKSPDGKDADKFEDEAGRDDTSDHRYAIGSQEAEIYGVDSFMTVWQPKIGSDQSFSLGQLWLAGGKKKQLQTIESGWQVYPKMYDTDLPCLFIFWTPDAYQSGCYNLSCSGFVQTNSRIKLGGAMEPDEPSWHIAYVYFWRLFKGNWWLYLGLDTVASAVGYYPAMIFNDGQMAKNATRMDFGGETVGEDTWPAMGSGAFAADTAAAATHFNLGYLDQEGAFNRADLTLRQPTPELYTAMITSSPFIFLYYGGPGSDPDQATRRTATLARMK